MSTENDEKFSKRLEHTAVLLIALIRNIHIKRALQNINSDPKLNFWRMIYGNCLDMAVIEWCKLFGSDNPQYQSTHWKNIVSAEDHDYFRNRLFERLEIEESGWRSYRNVMKDFRDNVAVHHAFDFLIVEKPQYPVLDLALQSAYFYYEYLIPKFQEHDIGYPPGIREYGEYFYNLAIDAARQSIESTSHLRDVL